MADNHAVLKCPLCEGHGEVTGARLREFVRKPELEGEVEGCLARASDPGDKHSQLVEVTAGSSEARDFQQDVHPWNPQLPMWRRSPKE